MAKVMKRTAPRGFTLIELVVVVAVIAILAALLVPTILGQADRARVSRAKTDVNEIGKAAARMRADTDSTNNACYTLANMVLPPVDNGGTLIGPSDCGAFNPCTGRGAVPGELCWGGPYLPSGKQDFRDPWNNTYQLIYDYQTASTEGRQGSIVVWSYGLNKQANKGRTQFDCEDAVDAQTGADDICAVF